MAQTPATMRAWVVAKNGEPKDALELETRPAPSSPTGSNILVKVSHAGLNPVDPHLMANVPSWLPFRRRPIAGMDFVGQVVKAGPAAAKMAEGTEVCGALAFGQIFIGAGSLAEYVVVSSEMVAVKPDGLTSAAAVGAGIAGQTAALIMQQANVQKGDTVLINGASGGVGSMLVQVAKGKGATVTAVCSGANEAFVRRLGADEVIDYKAHDDLYHIVAETHKDSQLSFIFDCVGDDVLFTRSTAYLKPEGKFLTIVGGKTQGIVPFFMHQIRPTWLGGTPRTYKILGLAPSGVYARQVAQWVDEGLLKEVPIEAEFKMGEAVQAYERLVLKRTKGKLVVRVSNE